jgi:hypothetical protein
LTVESHKHDVTQILGEALDHERATLREYYNLLALVVDKSVWLEEYAREQTGSLQLVVVRSDPPDEHRMPQRSARHHAPAQRLGARPDP